jgi:hypothetical protein
MFPFVRTATDESQMSAKKCAIVHRHAWSNHAIDLHGRRPVSGREYVGMDAAMPEHVSKAVMAAPECLQQKRKIRRGVLRRMRDDAPAYDPGGSIAYAYIETKPGRHR